MTYENYTNYVSDRKATASCQRWFKSICLPTMEAISEVVQLEQQMKITNFYNCNP